MFDKDGRLLVDLTGAEIITRFNANTILAANVDNTPLALTIAEQRLVGRITGGNIAALTAAQVLTLLGVSSAIMEINIPAGNWNYPPSNPAPLETVAGTNGEMSGHAFNDTTEEFIVLQPAFRIPANIDSGGTVYFKAEGFAKVADGNELQLRFSHSAKAKGEDWDVAYSTKDSGDYVTDAQQDELDEVEWDETVSNLGWTAGDLLRIMLSRIAITDGTKVSGDWYGVNFFIRIPVT